MTVATIAIPGIAGLGGCTADANDDVSVGSQDQTESIAGSGAIALHGWTLNYASTSGGDELIRVGEKLRVQTSLDGVVQLLYGGPNDGPAIEAIQKDPSKLALELRLSYTRGDGSSFDAPPVPMKSSPSAGGGVAFSSDEVVVPSRVKRLRVEVAATFDVGGVPTTRLLLGRNRVQSEFVVYGAYVPNKLALFDTVGGSRRTRVVEGGSLIRGAQVLVSYTDWRLDTVCDKSLLDTKIGERYSYNRFGPLVVDAAGVLEYVVSAVVSTDGGRTWSPIGLTRDGTPEVFGRSDWVRYTMEAQVPIPADAASSLQIAFHVQAYLQVPNYSQGEVWNERYAPGSRILLRDVWDNNDGQNYSVPIGND